MLRPSSMRGFGGVPLSQLHYVGQRMFVRGSWYQGNERLACCAADASQVCNENVCHSCMCVERLPLGLVLSGSPPGDGCARGVLWVRGDFQEWGCRACVWRCRGASHLWQCCMCCAASQTAGLQDWLPPNLEWGLRCARRGA